MCIQSCAKCGKMMVIIQGNFMSEGKRYRKFKCIVCNIYYKDFLEKEVEEKIIWES